jgi:poly(3-hydroxybutyrate) depolymerase
MAANTASFISAARIRSAFVQLSSRCRRQRREYANCAGDASVQLYTIEGAGHQWFGGMKGPEWLLGPFSRIIDATRVMWEFFQKHPLKKSVPT